MEKSDLLYTNATKFFQNMQRCNFEGTIDNNSKTEGETVALCECIVPYLTQVLTDIPDPELHNDNHLKHTDVFISEVKKNVRSLNFSATKTILQQSYQKKFSEKYFDCALMKLLSKLELIPDDTFIDGEPNWIDFLLEYWIPKIAQSCSIGIWNTTKAIRFVSCKMPHLFQQKFCVTGDILKQACDELEIVPKELLEKSHLLSEMVNAESLISEYNPSKISAEQIEKYVEYAGYVMLPEYISYLIFQSVIHKDWGLWVSIWNRLDHPVLQYYLLWAERTNKSIDEDIRSSLIKCKDVVPSIYLYFFHWLNSWKESIENLYSFETEYGWLAEQLKKKGIDKAAKEEIEKLESDFLDISNNFLAFLDKEIEPTSIIELVAGIRSLADIPDSTTKTAHEFIRGILIKKTCERYKNQKFIVHNQTLSQLILMASIAVESEAVDKEYLELLWQAVESNIRSSQFYWNGSIISQHQHDMMCVAELFLSTHTYQSNTINDYISENQVRFEGWGVKDINLRSNAIRSECFLLCSFLMSLLVDSYYPDLESRGRQLISIVKYAINQEKSCNDTTLCSIYQHSVLLLAKCIASQKMSEYNDVVDQLLIDGVESFVDLIELLVGSSSILSKDSGESFKMRYETEWPEEKQFLLSYQESHKVAVIETRLKKILTDINF